jgi:hypothetical protein
MKSAATPPPCCSARNAKHAPSSPDQGKAPPPSAQATRTNKKRQTEMAPLTPIAPSPSGNLASLSPPLFFIPEATASNTPIATAVAGSWHHQCCCWCFRLDLEAHRQFSGEGGFAAPTHAQPPPALALRPLTHQLPPLLLAPSAPLLVLSTCPGSPPSVVRGRGVCGLLRPTSCLQRLRWYLIQMYRS